MGKAQAVVPTPHGMVACPCADTSWHGRMAIGLCERPLAVEFKACGVNWGASTAAA